MIAALALITAVRATGDAPENAAHAAILVHMDSGKVLYEKNADERMLIASTTKIMTALVALENCSPEERVTITEAYCAVEGSSAYLTPGGSCTVEELLYGLLLASGNDAALALAEHVGGSEAAFVEMMNDCAAQLKLRNTHFSNPHGLDAEDHYSTAEDLARITAEAMKNELFAQIVSTPVQRFDSRLYANHNKLLRRFDGCCGVKTGYTKAAGRCLVSAAERDGLRLVCVTLSDPDDWADHTALLNWGFENWCCLRLFPGGIVGSVPVIGGEAEAVRVAAEGEVSVLVQRGSRPTVRVVLPPFVYAEVVSGEKAGFLQLVTEDGETKNIELVFTECVAAAKAQRLSILEQIQRGLERSLRYGGVNPYGLQYAPCGINEEVRHG